MKIYVNRKPVTGPWGGGSKVLYSIINALTDAGHEVTHILDNNTNLVFCVDPRPGSENCLLSYADILTFQKQHRKVRIIQRVGDVGTHSKPDLTTLLKTSTMHSDVSVFPSSWAFDYMRQRVGYPDPTDRWQVISNAPMKQFYNQRKNKLFDNSNATRDCSNPLRFVTHHWSTNDLKGFEFYKILNDYVDNINCEFTYIGRTPDGFKLTKDVRVLNEEQISFELPKHDIYVTASLFEAGANHVLEAVACGLPIIYHNDGGSIVEYCKKFGVGFDGSLASFQSAYNTLLENKDDIAKEILAYDRSLDDVSREYVELCEDVISS